MDLQNKIAWITGASSGIGEAIAYELAKHGCRLVLSGRKTGELERVAKATQLNPENVMILAIDLEHPDQAENWTNQVVAKFGRIDILVNNGGISQEGLALDTNAAVEAKIMNINYFGNVALSKAVARIMKQQGGGKIAVTTSIIGKFGLPGLSTYAASKHALYGFYDSFRLEVRKDNIRILLVAPGFINTRVTLNAVTPDGSTFNKNSPAQENGMETAAFARKYVAALRSNRTHKYIGKKELLSIPFKTFFPKLFYNIMFNMNEKKMQNR
ncbi:MAG: SDR family NAD(P)-dependent oxidoreductase [Flavobacteriales bacterium]|nr:SDR family NAD(P)-dependent oxidoreductase [Flavobacteriales bacterium]